MPQSFACLYVHLIFSTKNRRPWIEEGWFPELKKYFAGTLRGQGSKLIDCDGVADHVHLLFSQSKQVSLSDLTRDLKANSSGWIHREYPQLKEFAWQSGYAAFSVSYSGIPDVQRYIANQREHHRTRSFREELVAFLEKHHVEYDERYLFD
ncbi:MAG: IS200/IS605 family transposase [Pirellulaceae bacterium]